MNNVSRTLPSTTGSNTHLYISFPLGITHGHFSGSRTPSTLNPSLTPYGGSHTIPSNNLPVTPSPSYRNPALLIGVLVRSAVNMPPNPGSRPYCSKLPLNVLFFSSPRILRPSISLPKVTAPNCAHAMG